MPAPSKYLEPLSFKDSMPPLDQAVFANLIGNRLFSYELHQSFHIDYEFAGSIFFEAKVDVRKPGSLLAKPWVINITDVHGVRGRSLKVQIVADPRSVSPSSVFLVAVRARFSPVPLSEQHVEYEPLQQDCLKIERTFDFPDTQHPMYLSLKIYKYK